MKIIKVADYCDGDFGEAKGHLDSQVFPCKKDPSVEARKRRKKKKASIELEAVHSFPIVRNEGALGVWEKWKNKSMSDADFVRLMKHIVSQQGSAGISKDPSVRRGIIMALQEVHITKNYAQAAEKISAFLSMGEHVDESYFVNAHANWYKRVQASVSGIGERLTGPDMSNLTPAKMEEAKMWLQQKYPNISWTLEKVVDFMREHFGGKPKPLTGPQDLAHRLE